MQTIQTKIPLELIERKQWVNWQFENSPSRFDESTGKIVQTKVPYQINGFRADATDRTTWASYDEVISVSDKIGYVLTESDPYTVIDLDNCIEDGEIKIEARRIVAFLNSYTEISQSGTGLHIFVKAKKNGDRSKNTQKKFEMYDKNRFIIMTGNHLEHSPLTINKAQEKIIRLYNHYLGANEVQREANYNTSPELTDEEIIKLASKAKNGDKFQRLFNGDSSGYGSWSESDQALTNILAFYSQDHNQIDRIFSSSGLMRDKWNRKDYKERTIKNAINGLNNVYKAKLDFQISFNEDVKDSKEIDLKETLKQRRNEELERIYQALLEEWEMQGGKGSKPKKPSILTPINCAKILTEYISFILFDLEENTRVAMYQPKEGVYTRNATLIKRVISWLEPKLNNSKAEDVIYFLTNMADVKELTVSRYLIPVQNGVFNLETKTLEPFSPDYVFTTKISTPYMEDAKNPIIDGWNVEKWLQSIACNDSEIVKLLWQVINDSLNGNYTRKKAIFLVGDGNNGKGTFQELITNLIGMKNIATLKVNQFEERFQLGVLEGKTAVIGDDVPANVYIDDSSNFNSVVTGDVVQVELKNKQPYNTVFRCSVIQSTNGMPKFRNKTQGTIRRVLIVPFNADFNGTMENFKIKDEYIKNEEVLQYVLYKAINMDFEKFDIPEASARELEIFKQDNDPILDFKHSIFDEWQIEEVPKYIVYEFYKVFCQNNGFKATSSRSFHNQFKKYLGVSWIDGSARFRYTDLIYKLGDLDRLGIGFPDESRVYRSYRCY